MTAPILQIEDLVKDYDSLRAVDNVSFEVRPGEVFGLLGPNGAGKTSIISVITTLEQPTSGRVTVSGHDVTKEPKHAKVLTGVVPQELIHHGFFNVEELMGIFSGYYGLMANQARINYLLKELALEEYRHRFVKQLSGGTKRRILIAKALLHHPKLLLLDEPTAGVDVELRRIIWRFVRELRDSGIAILLTTHHLGEAEALCDRIGILDKGKLVLVGEPQEIVERYTKREVVIVLNQSVPTISHPYLREQNHDRLCFVLPAAEDLGTVIADTLPDIRIIKNVTIREGRLEDAFNIVLGNHHQ